MISEYPVIDFRLRIPPKVQYGGDDMPEDMKVYLEKYNLGANLHLDTPDLIAMMDDCNMPHGVLQAEIEFGDYMHINNSVKDLCKAYPDRFTGFITFDPTSADDPIALLEASVEWGCKGINIEAWSYDKNPTDPYYMKIIDYCAKHDLIVTTHTSINFSVFHSIYHSHPRFIDEIACKYPDLKIVANHGGFPWVTEMVAVAWKHPNVYIEFGGVTPKYMAKPGTGWEPMLCYGNSQLKKQLLWATDWPIIDCRDCLQQFQALPLKPEVIQLATYGNAARLLGLE